MQQLWHKSRAPMPMPEGKRARGGGQSRNEDSRNESVRFGEGFCPKGEWTKFWTTFPQESRAQNFGHRPFRVKPFPKQTLIAERTTAHHDHSHCGRFARRVKPFEPSRCPRHGAKMRHRPQDHRPGPKVRTQTGTHTPGHGSRTITGPRSQVTAMERKYPLNCTRQSRGYEGALDARS